MNKAYLFCLSFLVILINSFSLGQNYFTDFENYSAGGQIACQDSINWTTWSLNPCDPVEDGYISTNYAYSGTKSFVVLPDNDVVKLLGNLTSGTWHISFDVLIPSAKAGYFNLLSIFNGSSSEWAIEIFFPDGGVSSVNAGGTGTAQFVFPYDTWFSVEIIVNLDSDSGELKINDNSIYVWQWTLGATGTGGSLMLAAVDFFGLYTNNEMYVDNFWFGDTPVTVEFEETILAKFSLEQNYPNPFNPSTRIQYKVSSNSQVSLVVYDLLGKEIQTLVNEEKPTGAYEVTWYAELPSGVYFYQLKAGSFVERRKMILMK